MARKLPGATTVMSDRDSLLAALRTPIWVGTLAVGGFFGGFGTWAATMPIAGAAVAQGIVSPDTNSKSIQHLEGGIVRSIEVKDGMAVSAGDVLAVLDDTKARSTLQQQQIEYRAAVARQARLDAEWRNLHGDENATPEFPAALLDEAERSPAIKEIVEAEQRQFETRKKTLESSIAVLKQTIEQYKAEIAALTTQVAAIDRSKELAKKEIALIDDLRSRGLEKYSRLIDMQQAEADLDQKKASIEAQIASKTQQIESAKLQIAASTITRLDEVTSDIVSTRSAKQEAAEKVASSQDVLNRTVIRSPVDGTILNLQLHTIGGVIEPGQTVMDIVPKDDELIIDARVNPNDIDAVHEGQTARLQLLAYPSREMPMFEGSVETVSASVLVDSATDETYYLAKIKVPPSALDKLGKVSMVPGMSVQALIVTGERTFFDYLIEPVLKSASKSFRET
ncbi:HlyD family type I secretion periplasmic adaptor subunit [Propylenella binzhouense]|nr:HlyD family type I secretion periplasmic adaptor subunit [Propylenella binzhouense]